MSKKCPYCGSFDLKEEDDRSKPPVSYVPRPVYHKKYTCKKCRKVFSKEEMDNPQMVTEGEGEATEQAGAESASVEGYQATFAQISSGSTPSSGFASTNTPSSSSFPSQQASSGSGFFTTETGHAEPEEKKSYMDVMKEKQQYQAQQFQTTYGPGGATAPSPQGPKPVVKPAAGVPPVKPGRMKPVIKPSGVKPVIKAPAPPVKAPAPHVKAPAPPAAPSPAAPQMMEALPELDSLPELPSMDGVGSAPSVDVSPAPGFTAIDPVHSPPMTAGPVAPAFESVAPPAPAMPKPATTPPASMKPAPGPVMKPVGTPVTKPPVKPSGVVKPAGVKPMIKPPIKPPARSGFQQVEPAANHVPTMPGYSGPVSPVPMSPVAPGPVPAFASPQAPVLSKEDQLRSMLHPLFAELGWQEEKRHALIEELVRLPPDQQEAFLKDLGIELPPAQAAPAPVPAPVPIMPGFPAPVAPAVQPPVALKPAMGGITKPPVKPGMKPAVAPPVKPMKPSSAAGLFGLVDTAMNSAENFDVDAFLDSMDDTGIPAPSIPGIPDDSSVIKQPLAKLIPTTVEKKTEEDLRREEERIKAAASTDSNLVYLRLLAFEKACNGQKSYKAGDLSKMLKDLDTEVLIGFIQALDNDILLAYDDGKKQVTVNDPAPAEIEFMSREFEKWLRFGRL
nr:hypothetical protein [Candidatus Sigynarchaeota archaeon]